MFCFILFVLQNDNFLLKYLVNILKNNIFATHF